MYNDLLYQYKRIKNLKFLHHIDTSEDTNYKLSNAQTQFVPHEQIVSIVDR